MARQGPPLQVRMAHLPPVAARSHRPPATPALRPDSTPDRPAPQAARPRLSGPVAARLVARLGQADLPPACACLSTIATPPVPTTAPPRLRPSRSIARRR